MRLEFRLQSASLLTGCHTAVKRTFTFDSRVSGHLLVSLDRQDKIEPSIYDRVIVEISLKGQQHETYDTCVETDTLY